MTLAGMILDLVVGTKATVQHLQDSWSRFCILMYYTSLLTAILRAIQVEVGGGNASGTCLPSLRA